MSKMLIMIHFIVIVVESFITNFIIVNLDCLINFIFVEINSQILNFH